VLLKAVMYLRVSLNLGLSCLAEEMLDSHEGLFSVELVGWLVSYLVVYLII